MSRVETVEEFLARGGQIDTVPRGAMTEAGWTPEQRNINSPEFKARAIKLREERVAVTAAEVAARKTAEGKSEIPKRRHIKAKPAKPAKATFVVRAPHPNGRDGSKTQALLDALGAEWLHVTEIAAKCGLPRDHVSARLTQLRLQGEVISFGQRPRMLWARPGTQTPEPVVLPPGEFDSLGNLQLLAKANEVREAIREGQRLIVRIEREIRLRTRAARTGA